MKYSIIFPCRNEEETIGTCIAKARKAIPKAEIIVIDNNSKDKSAKIARNLGARVVQEKIIGYGAALLRGFGEAKGDYIIMCDADDTYDLEELPLLLKPLEKNNYDIIIGNRLNSKMKDNSMSFLHKYLGNPLLSTTMHLMFGSGIKDTNSGFRVIKRKSLNKLNLESTGMELASEMLIKATKQHMKVKEVDITYYPRKGISKLRSFNDGWKHFKMMLLYSPNHLFLVPGAILFIIGTIILLSLINGPISIFGLRAGIHPTIVGSLLTILGYQVILLWLYAKTYSLNVMGDKDKSIDWIYHHINLEHSIIIGGLLFLIGIIISIFIIWEWFSSNFGSLFEIGKAIFAMTIMILGIQTVFSGFMLSILGTKHSYRPYKIQK